MQSYPDPTTLTGASYWSSSCKLALPKNALQLWNFFKRNLVFMFEPYTYINQAWNIKHVFSTSFMRTAIKTINFLIPFLTSLGQSTLQLYISRRFHLQFPVSWESWGANDWNISRLAASSKLKVVEVWRSYPLLPVTWHFLKQQVRASLFFFSLPKAPTFHAKIFEPWNKRTRQKVPTCLLPPENTTGSENSNKISIRNGDVSGRDIFRGLTAKGYGSALWLDEMLICWPLYAWSISWNQMKIHKKDIWHIWLIRCWQWGFLVVFCLYQMHEQCSNLKVFTHFNSCDFLRNLITPRKTSAWNLKIPPKGKGETSSPPIFGFKMFVWSLTNRPWKVTGTH